MKLKEIKDLLNTLTDDQLEQTAHLMGVDEPGFDIAVEILTEPYLQTDEGLSPPWPDMTEEERKECPEAYPAGTVFFYKAMYVSQDPAFEVKQDGEGFRVFNIASGTSITKICPREIADEICRDFNSMQNGDFSPLDKYGE